MSAWSIPAGSCVTSGCGAADLPSHVHSDVCMVHSCLSNILLLSSTHNILVDGLLSSPVHVLIEGNQHDDGGG